MEAGASGGHGLSPCPPEARLAAIPPAISILWPIFPLCLDNWQVQAQSVEATVACDRNLVPINGRLFPSLATSSIRAFAGGFSAVFRERKQKMTIGTVKFFNVEKGYGFIAPENGGADSFVHISAVERAGMSTLNKDQRVSYELETDRRGKTSAVNLAAA
jgi:CspA family cold shock protein